MKTKIFAGTLVFMLLAIGSYAQTNSSPSQKEIRKQERAERKARLKSDVKDAGQAIGGAATEVGQGAKETVKAAGTAIDRGASKAATAINTEADRIKARRDSSQAAKRDTL